MHGCCIEANGDVGSSPTDVGFNNRQCRIRSKGVSEKPGALDGGACGPKDASRHQARDTESVWLGSDGGEVVCENSSVERPGDHFVGCVIDVAHAETAAQVRGSIDENKRTHHQQGDESKNVGDLHGCLFYEK